jgi:16S rRNA (cytosine967-C5)-methyltransferase
LRVGQEVARGRRLDLAFQRAAAALEPRERAFVHQLTYGVARLRGRLDHLIDRCLRGDPSRLDGRVREVLRLGAYQLLYMGGVPDYAAVSQSVNQAIKCAGRQVGGLVNAVLRAVAAAGDDASLFPDPDADPAAYLASWGSHPRWLVDRWLERWSPDQVRRLVELDNRPAEVHLAPLDASVGEAIHRLSESEIEGHDAGLGSGCVRLAPGVDPRDALAVLPSVIQDPGAHLVTRYADLPIGTKLADLCAAPGGKALALSGRAAYTLAADRSEVRMRMVRDNAQRTGRRLGLVVADARYPPVRGVDAVLIDVPCTGTGTLRRHPDGRWRLAPESLDVLREVQRGLLVSAAGLVPPGGLLIYSTCSLEPEENAGQVAWFLERRPAFALEATGAVPEELLDPRGCLEVLPQETGFDGSFAARLRRAA